MSLEGSVHTPMGEMKKKQLVIVGGGLALLVGVYVYRKRQAANAASSSSTSSGSGAAPSAATDPATGYPSGSPEDTAALQASSLASYGYGAGGGGGGSSLSTPPSGTTGFATNAAWAQAAEQYLAESAGGDPTKISAALGKYLTGQQVTDEQAQIIQSAIAFEGYPPVSGTDSYPPSIRQAPVPAPPPPSGGGSGADVTPKAPTRLQTVGPATRTSIGIGWDPSAGADHYELHMDGRSVGLTHDTWATPGALKPGSRHTFQVFALSVHGKKSPGSNTLTASTHK